MKYLHIKHHHSPSFKRGGTTQTAEIKTSTSSRPRADLQQSYMLSARLLPSRGRAPTRLSLVLPSCLLLSGLLRCLLSRRLLGLGLLLCSQKRRILMRAIHWLLRDRSRRRIHCCLLLGLHYHPAQVLCCKLANRLRCHVRMLHPVMGFKFGKSLRDMLAQNSR